jgi:hypothetical protein
MGVVRRADQPAFRVRVIEVEEGLLRADKWLCEDDLHSRADLIVFGEEALIQELARLGVARDALEPHWKVDFPI